MKMKKLIRNFLFCPLDVPKFFLRKSGVSKRIQVGMADFGIF